MGTADLVVPLRREGGDDQIARIGVDEIAVAIAHEEGGRLVGTLADQRFGLPDAPTGCHLETPQHPVTFDFAWVGINVVQDEAERRYLNEIGTSFNLSDEEVNRLISAARKLLRESPEFQTFLKRTQGRSK